MTAAPENFAKIDDVLWRGARPRPEQALWLVAQGIKSVINLELGQEDIASFKPFLAKLDYHHLPDWEPIVAFDPSREDQHLKDFLATLRALPHPTYVHCRDGQNRTGLASAAYELIDKGAPVDAVIAEMETYKGLWEAPDAAYLRSLAARIGEFRA